MTLTRENFLKRVRFLKLNTRKPITLEVPESDADAAVQIMCDVIADGISEMTVRVSDTPEWFVRKARKDELPMTIVLNIDYSYTP